MLKATYRQTIFEYFINITVFITIKRQDFQRLPALKNKIHAIFSMSDITMSLKLAGPTVEDLVDATIIAGPLLQFGNSVVFEPLGLTASLNAERRYDHLRMSPHKGSA